MWNISSLFCNLEDYGLQLMKNQEKDIPHSHSPLKSSDHNGGTDRKWLPSSTRKVSHRVSLLKGLAVYRELYQNILMESWLEEKSVVGWAAEATRMATAFRGSRITFQGAGLRLESLEPPDVSRRWATGVPFRVSGHYWAGHNIRNTLTGLWRKRTGPLLRGPKSCV